MTNGLLYMMFPYITGAAPEVAKLAGAVSCKMLCCLIV